ncbi:MAG: MaoC family dehydratase [Chloroflexi bacterium]|nr:MaoC family dehydratase [Chloroflexota bacterium]MBT3669282.1 MaoC family dehydratase [Chloroflexota bacterium]MBT4003107.1 MaoC family dehydratase [Chloroflexota bacterium]MBT4305989.1 MaoC family dehydratase [Chloroflexota bacterium]MBT4532633.1 MaoC family dehydratase [Chloroflexota bacterium]
MAERKNFNDFNIGDQFKETRVIPYEEVERFADVVGDDNPIHLDKEFAEKSSFKGRIVHGAFLIGFVSKILGVDFPGPGSIYLSQEIKFLRPVYVDSSVQIILEIIDMDTDKQRFTIDTSILNDKNKTCVKGKALIWYPD